MDVFQLLPLVFVAGGLLVAFKAVRTIVSARRFEQRASRAGAVVTSVRERWISSGSDSNSRTVYVPVVRFTAADGRIVEAETAGHTSFRRHESGDPIEVLYDPEDPSHVRLESGTGGMLSSAVTIAFGLFFALLALYMFGGLDL